MSRQHFLQIEQRLKTITLAGKLVPGFLGDPPSNTSLPYVFLTPTPKPALSESVAGDKSFLDNVFTVTCVAPSVNNVLALQEAVIDTLDGWAPQVAGWDTLPLDVFDAQPIQTATAAMSPESNTFPRWSVLSFHLHATKQRRRN